MNFPRILKKRKGYIDRIKPFMQKSVAKVLTGQRRVGKSFLLYQLIEEILAEEPDANIIYVNLEDFTFSSLQTAEDLHSYIISHSKEKVKNYIFIDEIQDIPGFEKVIRSLLLNEDNDIYITGSNAKMLSGELATYLSGRYIEFKIYSLSYSEFLEFHGLTESETSYELYSRYGGLPYLLNLPLEDETVNEYLKSVYSTIVFRDVVSRYKLRNTLFLEKLIQFLSENIGNLFSAKNISDYLKSQHTAISVNQIQSYTEYLNNAFLIHRVERYDLIGKRVFEIGEKYYFENMGIRNIVIGYRITDKAKILENLVYNHLLYKSYDIKVGYYGDKEIDFVGEKNGEKLYIQVALKIDSDKTAEREFGNLLKIQDNYPKIVVTEDTFSGNSYEGIRHCSIRQFLME
ncbi:MULTISPECIES: ATP-binding protein [unclassified Bacteroides]|uniref:ATP-binding protein n=1 Tax=unclassified Bacteroides TaxID=2646097 RepID=UPI001C37936D|nr:MULTISPECIES: ATP-binding protein [unclassified Bacteroides]MBV3656047.1 ATP-binding protein [Bacteroides sp. MSK.18.91]MBV3667844.1 ATP-binding protein [Bacteroides sp. MSK.18.83]MBV3712005.1 ATP-binding protein [Bacteroides sp. MSK.18.39]MBV3738806.1 ATP-binding protein [Bacteroides sp. MSK.18.37]MBV3753598.1 ATP-binding protein [Bacteroides sp. MSK.18.22]